MFNPGKFRDSIEILALQETEGGVQWGVSAATWAHVEPLERTNLFSKAGLGARSVRFTMRRRPLTLHQAIRWQGRHCFLTDIAPTEDRLRLVVTAALIEPVQCFVERTETTFDALNRPNETHVSAYTFPACLTEKYVRAEQAEPMTVHETVYVLVTPKIVSLSPGELVTVGAGAYTVTACHVLDLYKNEYEIVRKEDA